MCAGPIYGARRKPLIPGRQTGPAVPERNTAPPTFVALRDDEFVVGETYDCWLCASCDSVLAIARSTAGNVPSPHAVINIVCLDCEAARPYRLHQGRARRYPWADEPSA
jgi:hypothetical protein